MVKSYDFSIFTDILWLKLLVVCVYIYIYIYMIAMHEISLGENFTVPILNICKVYSYVVCKYKFK